MKKIKRLTALVLAGVMMMLMLTACGGAMTPVEQFEKELSQMLKASCGSNAKDISAETEEALRNVTDQGYITEKGYIGTTSFSLPVIEIDGSSAMIFDAEIVKNKVVSMTLTIIPVFYKTNSTTGLVENYTEKGLLKEVNSVDKNQWIEEMKEAIGEYDMKTIGYGVATKRLSNGNYTYAVSIKLSEK